MYSRSKYIVTEDNDVIIFSAVISHDYFSSVGLKIKSAGFCTIYSEDNNVHVSCFGESHSLIILSHPKEDQFLIERMLSND